MPRKRCLAIAVSTHKRCRNNEVEGGVGCCARHTDGSGDNDAGLGLCTCCLQVVSAAAALRASPRCGHALHVGCAKEWVRTGALTCPTCRTEFDEEFLNVVEKDWKLFAMDKVLTCFAGAWITYRIVGISMLNDIAAAARHLLSRPEVLIAHSALSEFTFVTPDSYTWTLPRGVPPFTELTVLLQRAESFQELYAARGSPSPEWWDVALPSAPTPSR